jgi:hypothetical protein
MIPLKINDLKIGDAGLSPFPDKSRAIWTGISRRPRFPLEKPRQAIDFKWFLRAGTGFAKERIRPRRFTSNLKKGSKS